MYEVNLLDVNNVDVSLQDEETVDVDVQEVRGGGDMFAVTYVPQNLAEEEKQQARSNIDALGNSELSSAIDQALLIAKESGEFKGEKGDRGDNGEDGAKGADGYTPIRGTDYWTETDKNEIKTYVDEAILGGEW